MLDQSICLVIRVSICFCTQFNVCYSCEDSPNQPCESYFDESLSSISKCPKNNYYYNGDIKYSLCFQQKPPYGGFCDSSTLLCQECEDRGCLECDSSLKICSKCNLGNYQYKQKCFGKRPKNVFCNQDRVCQDCQDIQPCGMACDSNLKCIGANCNQGEFFFKNNCINYFPEKSLCDFNTSECQSCQNQSCYSCDDTQKACIQCRQDEYLYQNQCYQEQPANTLRIGNSNYLFTCNDPQNQKCEKGCYNDLKCIPNNPNKIYYNLNGVQSEQIPSKSFCDPNTKFCLPCFKHTCETCDFSLKACTSCKSGQFFFNQDCYVIQPQNTFCSSPKQCQQCADKSGKVCNYYCDSKLQCKLCKEKEYEYQGKCLQTKPTKTFCDENNQKCIDCNDKVCQSCDSTLKKCLTCPQSQYLFENQCQIEKPIGTYCKNIFQDKTILYQECSKCYQSCLYCTGPSEEECLDCQYNDSNQYPKCNQSTSLVYNSTITPNQLKQMINSVSKTSQSTTIASISMSLAQGVIQSSSFSLLISGLTSQKLTYLLLIKSKLPKSIQSPLELIKEQLPSEQFQNINFLKVIINENNGQDSFYNSKFKSVNLNFSIFKTCGQGVSIIIICELLFVLFYFLDDKVTQVKIRQMFTLLYSKLFSGLIVQYIQLSVSMFTIGINSQILEFIQQGDIQYYAVKIILKIVLLLVIGLINYKIYFYLNIQKVEQVELQFAQITREKVQNETIQESKSRRNFMMIFLMTQSIIQPTIFILLNQNYIAVCVVVLIMQTVYITSISILMPFYSKITNIYFLIDSIVWLILYIEFFIINILSTKEDVDSIATELDNTCWTFIVTVQIILLLNPIYLLVTITIKLINIVSKKLQSKKLNSLLKKSQEKEIFDNEYGQIEIKLNNPLKVELSSYISSTKIDDIVFQQKNFDKFIGKYQKSN